MGICIHWSLVGILSLTLFGLLLSYAHVKAQTSGLESTSPSTKHENQSQDITCGQRCHYDGWFQRAFCDERNLYNIPSSEGCKDTVLLEMQGNNLTNISVGSFLGYSHLKTLDLSYNEITVICPGVFLHTRQLRNILINNNHIKELKNGTFTGTENHLSRIYLKRNKIADIHENVFHGFTALFAIYLSYNRIKLLPSSVFHGLDRLQDVIIGYNKINHLHAFIFQDLISLESVSLRNNKLTWLPRGLFHGLPSLREVVLSNNELVMLPSPQNLGLTSVHRLYLDNNNLTRSSSIYPYFQQMYDEFDISGNPLICDCAFITIQEWYKNKSVETLHESSVMCTMGDFKYHLGDILPISCNYQTNITVSSTEPSEEQTNTIQYNTAGGGASEVMTSHKGNFADNNHVRRLPFNQYHGINTAEIVTVILSLYCAVCLTILLILWICHNCHCCYLSKRNSDTNRENLEPKGLQEDENNKQKMSVPDCQLENPAILRDG